MRALVIFYFLLVRRVKKNNDVKLDNISLIIFSFAAVIAINIWNLYSRSTSYNGIPSYGYAIICCLLLFIIQFSLFERGKLEKEKEIIEKVVSVSGKQQFYSQNNIDLINRKCHDLKHSIEAMELMNDEERRKTISELKQAVMIYDNTIKTGNATLDAIFAEKSLICEKYNIDFSYMVDTNKLDFMEIVDLYTLFGNALDNAIESCLAEADKDKRIVTVNISQRNSLVSVCIQNYCKSEVDFQGDLPVTNKSDKENHGFGVKSMKYIVEKYKGSMVMKKEKDIFEVSMLFSVK